MARTNAERVANIHRTETEQTPNKAPSARGRAILSRRLRDRVLLKASCPRFGFGTDPKRIPSAENLPADRPEKTKSKLFPVTLFIVPIRPDLEQSFLKAPASLSLRHDGPSTVESPQSISAQVQPDRRVLSQI